MVVGIENDQPLQPKPLPLLPLTSRTSLAWDAAVPA